MMVLDHVGDQEAMVYAQLGQQPLVHTTETSLEPRHGLVAALERARASRRAGTGEGAGATAVRRGRHRLGARECRRICKRRQSPGPF
jgi:hypothetical protein